jgi:hypothetical protein
VEGDRPGLGEASCLTGLDALLVWKPPRCRTFFGGIRLSSITLAVGALREKLEGYLAEHFGTYVVDRDGDFHVDYESARVFVCPRDWQGKRTVVSIFSVTNVDVPITEELTHFLVAENLSLLFGHFALRDAENEPLGDVWFAHTLLGDFLDADELVTALSSVARTANKYDDIIKARFGGRLYTE